MPRPAELARGLVWEENFSSRAGIVANGGVVTGAATFDQSRGMRFDGSTNYVQYRPNTQPCCSGFWSAVIEFTPEFVPAIPGVLTYLLDTQTGGRTIVRFESTGEMQVYTGATAGILNLAKASYIAYWRQGARNCLVMSCRSGANTFWLNGTQISTNATPWTAGPTGSIRLGANAVGTEKFSGYIRSIKLFRGKVAADLLTVQEAIDYTNGSTFNYMSKAVCIAPMTADTYDPTNTRILDVSGHGNHLNYTAGASAPTKLATRGFSIDGGDLFYKSSFGLTSMTQGFTAAGVAMAVSPGAANRALFTLTRTDNNVRAVYLARIAAAILTRFSIMHNNAGSAQQTFWPVPFGTWYSWVWSLAPGLTGSQLFINGRLVFTGGALLAPNGYDGAVYLGSDATSGELGGLKHFALWPFRFSPLQALDYHASVMGDLNRV
jgi:hypothetical protein